ncbi:MAG: hypothetical protein CSA45_00715 [Gammaproteobacteria bacterium]|nr:MAG: hypothetical protein CSA45_00715 [Gammaproteobacteria bacterium]
MRIYLAVFSLWFGCLALAEDTVVTFHKPYGCELTVEGRDFYFREINANLPAFPLNFVFARDHNVYQIQQNIQPGRYAFSLTWKRAFYSKNRVVYKTIFSGVNDIIFQPPIWCDLKGLGNNVWEKAKSGTEKGIEASKTLGEKGVNKVTDLIKQAREKLSD